MDDDKKDYKNPLNQDHPQTALVTVKQYAKLHGVDHRTIYEWIDKGVLKAYACHRDMPHRSELQLDPNEIPSQLQKIKERREPTTDTV